MTFPVTPSAPSPVVEACACSYAGPVRASRSRASAVPSFDRAARACTTVPAVPSGAGIRIPFGHDRDGNPTLWESFTGRRLLVHHRDAASYPHLPFALAVTTALAQASHDVHVLDPAGRHLWLAHLQEGASTPVRWASTPGWIEQVIDDLAATAPGRPRLLVVAGLEQTLDSIRDEHRRLLTDMIVRSGRLGLTVLASTTDRTERWFPTGLIRAFDDVIERGTTVFDRHSYVVGR